MDLIDWPNSTEPYKTHPPINSVGMVMPFRDALKFLKLAFYSVVSFTDKPYMFVAVDNMSSMKTRKFMNIQVKNHNIHIIAYQDEFNYSAQINQGIKYLFKNHNIKYGLIVNSDIVVEPNWISKMLSLFDHQENLGIIGPSSNRASIEQEKHRDEPATLVEYVSGFCMLFKRDVYEQLNGFDESFKGGTYEDRDFCYRASNIGYQTAIANKVHVHHFGGATRRFNLSSDTSLVRNRKRFFDKYPELDKVPVKL